LHRKYSGNYRAQLVIPIEVRDKIINSVRYHNQFPIITLPLMTTYATFVINGCERVIVSQIIRSPGVYFEKNKNQKIPNKFKRKLSADGNKLRSFTPSGQAFISTAELFFAIPTIDHIDYIPDWNENSISYYSLKYLKVKEKNFSFDFLQSFKLYRIISKNSEYNSKIKLIQLFLKWLKLQNNILNLKNNLEKNKIIYLLKYYNFLIKLLIKYEILQLNLKKEKLIKNQLIKNNHNWLNQFSAKNKLVLSKEQIFNLSNIYDKTIFNSQKLAQIQLNVQLLLIAKKYQDWLSTINNFSFLKKNLKQLISNLYDINQLRNFKNLRPTIYFSVSLKDESKYVSGNSHKYVKTKTNLLLYRKDHEIKTNYNRKYDEKDLYTATLIPEYGSWIRFTFQKNTKINSYKYPIKNQEDEIIIQLDKINQKPILDLLKEMGLTDLEIYQNLQHSDFFYFTKPFLLNSKHSYTPLPRFNLNLNYFKNISEFSRIFDSNYYRLGRVGRLKINNRLNLKLSESTSNDYI
jgi:hypothetical protein